MEVLISFIVGVICGVTVLGILGFVAGFIIGKRKAEAQRGDVRLLNDRDDVTLL